MKDSAALVIKQDGIAGLFGRGLKTRIITNGLQGLLFNIMYDDPCSHFPPVLHELAYTSPVHPRLKDTGLVSCIRLRWTRTTAGVPFKTLRSQVAELRTRAG